MSLPAVSHCQASWHWPHLPIYLRERSTYPLVAPFLSTTVCSVWWCRAEEKEIRLHTHFLLSLNFFHGHFDIGCRPSEDRSMNNLVEKNMIESIELVARIVRSCREKMDTSNRLSPRGVSTPGALFPLFPRDLTYLSFHWYCIRTATDDDKSRESLARFCWKTSKQIRVNDTPHPQAWIRDLG